MNKEEHICAKHEPNNCLVANYQYQLEQSLLSYFNEIYNQVIKDYFNKKGEENNE